MKHRIFASVLALSLVLAVSPARAAETVERFPTVNSYPGYGDVAETDWFYSTAKLCYEIGLMTGTETGFKPNQTLSIAECAALTARVRVAYTGETLPEANPSLPWYQRYFDYLNGTLSQLTSSLYGAVTWKLDTPQATATRSDFLVFMAWMVDGYQDSLPALNSISTLPDVGTDNVVLFFYNAGVLTGVDQYGTFAPDKTLSRAECAAMVSRIARSELRLTFTPADGNLLRAAGVSADTLFFRTGVTAGDYLPKAMARIQVLEQRDAGLGVEFNWFHTTEDGSTYLDSVKRGTLSDLGVTRSDGTDAYAEFDVQVFYSRYLDLSGALR